MFSGISRKEIVQGDAESRNVPWVQTVEVRDCRSGSSVCFFLVHQGESLSVDVWAHVQVKVDYVYSASLEVAAAACRRVVTSM